MKRLLLACMAWLCLCFAVTASSATQGGSLLDFGIWMRAIDKLSVTSQQRLARGEFEAAATDARRLGELYALMETFYRQPGRPLDAAAISREGKELAAQAVLQIQAQQMDAAADGLLKIARACNDCHDEYKPVR
ncbi:hypothetical protein LNV09_16090 [Paucibacter sp. B2R-40]|uniref:hypothetical protein n=1 Tax=Paucibacter sp. B2R-40 TaxID=2893554 RepID=UPI0021E43CC1|nr:hypothetical protein [Paucibacter sp. B2R-40]MCV2355665.1 hypothetical protein [Paucibacter sp. B2R-40]